MASTLYYYVLNAQGDVIALLNSAGALAASYNYGAWGNYSVHDKDGKKTTDATFIGHINPLRYRGYYYDTETGFYYVSSRYYDPEIGRWINADNAIAGVGGDIRGYNLFAYCMNDPVNMSDHTGYWPQWIKNAASAVVNAVKKAVTVVANTVKSAVSSASNILKASSNSLPKKGEPDQVKLCQIQTEHQNRSDGMDQLAIPKETGTIIIRAICLSRMTTDGKMVKEGKTIFRPILLTK